MISVTSYESVIRFPAILWFHRRNQRWRCYRRRWLNVVQWFGEYCLFHRILDAQCCCAVDQDVNAASAVHLLRNLQQLLLVLVILHLNNSGIYNGFKCHLTTFSSLYINFNQADVHQLFPHYIWQGFTLSGNNKESLNHALDLNAIWVTTKI